MEGQLRSMDAEQLRENAHKMVDFIADYYKSIESFPVVSQVQPGYLRELLPDSAPVKPEALEDVLEDVQKKIMPGVTHWQSPGFLAYYSSNSSTAGFLGEMLTSCFSVVGFNWLASPAATELEVIVLDWMAKLLKLPNEFLSSGNGGGVIQSTASEGILVALLAARDKTLTRIGKRYFDKLVVYTSDQGHSSLQKACQIAGIFPENIRVLRSDPCANYSLNPQTLQEAVSHDISKDFIPVFLCATVGTTSSAAVDPLPALGKISQDNGMWFHIDAAHAGSACICEEYRHHIDGIENANSFSVNAHKWLLTNFDCSLLWVKERGDLIRSLGTYPEFLKNKATAEGVIDYKDWQIPLGRRFRSLKLWMVLRLYGVENLQKHIRGHIKLAKQLEEFVNSDSRFELVVPRTFSLVCFRLVPLPDDEDEGYKINHRLLEAINATGKIFITHTVLAGRFILRFAVGATLTEERHIREAWNMIQDQASILLEQCGMGKEQSSRQNNEISNGISVSEK